ncbi:hypothetical protein [Pseudomonas fluorescens]|nr:hypothetical protein [Pseudomonas fluorescens]
MGRLQNVDGCVHGDLLSVDTDRDAERPGLHSHAERGNDQGYCCGVCHAAIAGKPAPTGSGLKTQCVYDSILVGAGLPAMGPSLTPLI